MDKTPKHAALAMDQAVTEGDLWLCLPDVKAPTLILSGTESPIAREAEVKAMQQRMPAAKRVAFSGYGHGVNLLAPERCVSEVRKFLAGQSSVG